MRHPSVRVMLRGGIGNQLFIWAAGYQHARNLGIQLELDVSRINWGAYDQLDPRKFELGYFGLSPNRRSHLSVDLRQSIKRRTLVRTHRSRCNVHREWSFEFDPTLSSTTAPACLEGYFQSWRYFKNSESEVRSYLLRSHSLSSNAGRLLNLLSGKAWVAIHLRRGDYLRTNDMQQMGTEYYSKAIARLTQSLGDFSTVVFSDSIEDAYKIVPNANFFVGPAELKEAGDVLMLMSKSDGFIGANSTLSWWSAFLSRREKKLSIFPRNWFKSARFSTQDLLIPSWDTL